MNQAANLTKIQLALYELGLRLSQAKVAYNISFSADDGAKRLHQIVLDRLLTALLAVSRFENTRQFADSESTRLRTVLERWTELCDEDERLPTLAQLDSMIARADLLAEHLAREERLWFQLGRVIASTRDDLYSVGTPSWTQPPVPPDWTMPEAVYRAEPQLNFVDGHPPDWFREIYREVDDLLRMLSISRDSVFPTVADSDSQLVPGIEEHLWGWDHLETGLNQMTANLQLATRLVPRWDPQERTLSVGTQIARRYTRLAPTQFKVLDEFEANGWPDSVDNPSRMSKADNTIKDLNKRLVGQLITFTGHGASRIGWKLGPNAVTSEP